jgi:hypothetical protein
MAVYNTQNHWECGQWTKSINSVNITEIVYLIFDTDNAA